MSDETEDPDQAADRLDAALERIAALARTRQASDPTAADAVLRDVAAGLGSLIERVRAGLAGRQD